MSHEMLWKQIWHFPFSSYNVYSCLVRQCSLYTILQVNILCCLKRFTVLITSFDLVCFFQWNTYSLTYLKKLNTELIQNSLLVICWHAHHKLFLILYTRTAWHFGRAAHMKLSVQLTRCEVTNCKLI